MTENNEKKFIPFFLRKKYFSHKVCQNCLIFHPLLNTLKLRNFDYVKATAWRSLGKYREKF